MAKRLFVARCAIPVILVLTCMTGRSFCQDNVQPVTGDVTLGAMFEVNDLENGVCGDFDVYSLQNVLAVTWFLDRINNENFVPGVKIGLDVFRTCEMPELAARSAVTLLNNYSVGQDSELFGIIGASRTADAMAVSRLIGSLPASQRVLQISGSVTGKQLSDRELYPNFFRVIPPDDIQVQVMLELLEQLDWNYVAIVYDEDDYGRSAATELRRLAEDRQICVPVFESMPIDTSSEAFNSRANHIAEEMKSTENGLVRGMVILGGRRTTRQLIRKLASQVNYVNLILSEAIGLQPTALQMAGGQVITIARGALLTSPQYFDLPEFRTFWNQMWTDQAAFASQAEKIPWLRSYFQEMAGCDGEGLNCWTSTSSQRAELLVPSSRAGEGLSLYSWYELKAVAVMASLLKQLHLRECGSVSGLCPALSSAIRDRPGLQAALEASTLPVSNLAPMVSTFANVSDLAFDESGNVRQQRDIQYMVYNFRESQGNFVFKQVGTLAENTLTIDTPGVEFYSETGSALTWSQLPPAQCDNNHDCLQCEHDVSSDVIFMSGDFYVVAIVPVHSKDPENSLKCGDIQKVAGADVAEAVVYGVKDVNEKKNIFKDVLRDRSVGLVVINSCSSPLLVRQRLLDLHTGRLILPGGRNASSIVPNIMGYVGAYYSGNSIAAADTLTDIKYPFVQVSAASTSPDLSDRNKYPYFLRLVPPDNTQAQVILDVVTRLEANYVQIIYDSSTAYAAGLYKAIEEEINSCRYNVCIAQAIPVTPREDATQYTQILDKLRTKPSAKVVITILHPVEIEKTMDAIFLLRKSTDNFLFIGTDSWGRRYELIEGRSKLGGSLVLSQEVAVDKSFERYFAEVDPSLSENPWLKPFWEKRGECYFDKSFERAGKSGPCSEDFAVDYVQDFRAPFHINAVYALVLGFNGALSKYCGTQATGICDAMTSERLVAEMKKVQLDLYSTGRNIGVFDKNGDGVVGYKVLQVRPSANGSMVYYDVGDWKQDVLTLKMADLMLPGGSEFTSVCPNNVECSKCFNRSRCQNGPSEPAPSTGDGVSVAVPIGLSVMFIVIIVVLVVVIVILIRRRRPAPDADNPPERHQWHREEPDIKDRPPAPLPRPPETERTSGIHIGNRMYLMNKNGYVIEDSNYDRLSGDGTLTPPPSLHDDPTSQKSPQNPTSQSPPYQDPRMQQPPPSQDPKMQPPPPSQDPKMQQPPPSQDPKMQQPPLSQDPKMQQSPPPQDPMMQQSPPSQDPRMQQSPTSQDARMQQSPTSQDPKVQQPLQNIASQSPPFQNPHPQPPPRKHTTQPPQNPTSQQHQNAVSQPPPQTAALQSPVPPPPAPCEQSRASYITPIID